jgi:hypothetical protein
MTKVDDEDNRLSRCGCLGNIVSPDLAAKDVALLRLRMHPLGGHVIIRLPGFLPVTQSPVSIFSLVRYFWVQAAWLPVPAG